MYIGVDVGGSKVLAAVLDDSGVIKEKQKFETPREYNDFKIKLAECVASFATKDFTAGGIAIPVTMFHRDTGIAENFGNLPWHNVPIHDDLENILHCPVVVENDAKLGGLSEAMLVKETYHRVLYITVSTGIGYAFIDNGIIDTEAGDGGGHPLLLEHNGRLTPWENFASGKAIVAQYGKKAMDITDDETWTKITRDLNVGILELVAVFEPEVIIIGGSVGTYFERYGALLNGQLQNYDLPLLTIPPVIGAQRPEEAVVYGCYDLAKQTFGTNSI